MVETIEAEAGTLRGRLASTYATIMDETKERIDAAKKTLQRAHDTDPPYHYLDVEFCYLQVRRVIENIALAALFAHYEFDEYQVRKLIDETNGGKLLAKLKGENANAVPRSMYFDGETISAFGLSHEKDRVLSLSEFKRMLGDTAHGLHSGTLAKLMESKGKSYSVSEVNSWLDTLTDHLRTHGLVLPDGDLLYCDMTGDRAQVSYFSGTPAGTSDQATGTSVRS